MNNWIDNYQNGYDSAVQAENELTLQRYVAATMRKVFGKMSLGLLATALTSFLILSSDALMAVVMASPIVYLGLFLAEIALVIFLSARIDKLSAGTASAMFYVYSILNGVTLTPIFLAYTQTSIATTFAITAGTFGIMAIAGYITRQDLSKFGAMLIMGLLGLIVCAVVNMFLHNSMMELLISIGGVLIFVGLTAWDTQRIKQMCSQSDPSMVGKVATMGALTLYLDFINLFLHLLRLLGSRN